MKIAATGHRPDKLFSSWPYSEANFQVLVTFATFALKWMQREYGPITEVISGMALGWDQAIAQAALDLNIPLHAAIPCQGHSSKWPDHAKHRYGVILNQATKAVVVTNGPYTPQCMQARNVYMVDNCDIVLALWNGTSGGTENCLDYAIKAGKHFDNVWQQWKAFR